MSFVNSKKYGSGVQLYKKSNGDTSYYITYKDEDNKLKRIKIGDKSKGITEPFCNQKRNEIINSIKLGTEVPIKHKKRKRGITFNELGENYLEDLKLHATQSTLKEVNSKYKLHLLSIFEDIEVESIKTEDLENLQKEKIKKLSSKTTNSLIELFSTIFNYGLRKELFNIPNPAIKVKRFKIDNARDRYLQKAEIDDLYQTLEDNELLMLFVKLSLTTGGRLETILHIQKKDIDLSNATITLHDLKNKDRYKSFLTDDIIEILQKKWKNLKANDYIVSLDGTKFTSRQIQSRLKPKLDKLFNSELDDKDNKNRVVIHSLRHTFASHLAINGTPIYTIQKLMNHKDITQTMRYAKLSPDSGKEFIHGLYQ
jgi:integrase